jgi:tetratricopeptide (TPR) repeat protein
MKVRLGMFILLALVAGLCVPPVFAQATGSVKGVCKDVQGAPIDGATVEWFSQETGHKYDIKCKKGSYFSLGIAPGKYKVTMTGADGKEMYHFTNVPASLDENVLDFDLKKELANQAQNQGVNAEELKRKQAEAEKVAKENNTVKALNEKLASARSDMQAGNFDNAISTMDEATKVDPSRDVLWATLGDAYRVSASKQADAAEKTKRYGSAVESYQKAIDTKQSDPQNSKDPDANKKLASYYNNLGDASGKAGKSDDAIKAYTQAATLDPTGAGQYYFNLGAVLTNINKNDDAIQAFDKAIAADPNRADAYYWKGVNMINKATIGKDNKMIVPDGTAEALNKYLELKPDGPYAETVKQDLQLIGAQIETTFGKSKKTAKKP